MATNLQASAQNTNVIVQMCALMEQASEAESFICFNPKKQQAFWFRPLLNGGIKMPMDMVTVVHELHDVVINKAVEPLTVKLFSEGMSARKWCLTLASTRLNKVWHLQSFEASKKNWIHIKEIAQSVKSKLEKSDMEKTLKKYNLV